MEAYLANPEDLPFSPESLTAVADRTTTAIARWCGRVAGPVVFVTHQDPLQAAVLALTRRSLATLHTDKPGHAAIIEMRHAAGEWTAVARWEPEQGAGFPPTSSATGD